MGHLEGHGRVDLSQQGTERTGWNGEFSLWVLVWVKNGIRQLGVMAHAFDPNTWEAEAVDL